VVNEVSLHLEAERFQACCVRGEIESLLATLAFGIVGQPGAQAAWRITEPRQPWEGWVQSSGQRKGGAVATAVVVEAIDRLSL
jgi:hypothetical protein